jgi:Zn-dependent protease with chaperone function
MIDVLRPLAHFVVACVGSGTFFASFCALLVVPMLVWAAAHALHPLLARLENDSAWQAPLTAGAAVLPGASFALSGGVMLFRAAWSGCLDLPVGRELFAIIALLLALAVSRATVIALRRSSSVTKLRHASSAAPSRLEAAASAAGVAVRFVRDVRPFVALTGIRHPTVFVSEGALERLSDSELEAALRHERAHQRRGDQVLMTAIAFFSELLPLPVGVFIAMYRRSREFAADRDACRVSPPEELAGAIVRLAAAKAPCGAAALNDGSHTGERLRSLLIESRETVIASPSTLWRRRIVASVALLTAFMLGVTPAAIALVAAPCMMMRSIG